MMAAIVRHAADRAVGHLHPRQIGTGVHDEAGDAPSRVLDAADVVGAIVGKAGQPQKGIGDAPDLAAAVLGDRPADAGAALQVLQLPAAVVAVQHVVRLVFRAAGAGQVDHVLGRAGWIAPAGHRCRLPVQEDHARAGHNADARRVRQDPRLALERPKPARAQRAGNEGAAVVGEQRHGVHRAARRGSHLDHQVACLGVDPEACSDAAAGNGHARRWRIAAHQQVRLSRIVQGVAAAVGMKGREHLGRRINRRTGRHFVVGR